MLADIDWASIDTMLFDMDGTLLDLHFDNYFWQQHVPLHYAQARSTPHNAAQIELAALYRHYAGTLELYSMDLWESSLQLDIMLLKKEVAH